MSKHPTQYTYLLKMAQTRLKFSHLVFPLSLLCLSSLLSLTLCSELCNPQDKKVLLQIREQFGNPTVLVEAWNPNTDCCTEWSMYQNADITVNCNDQGRVIDLYIDLTENISSKVPPALGSLTALQTLRLSSIPHLYGPIPNEICSLTNLWYLSLTYVNLSNAIPTCMSQLNNLQYLDFQANNLTGRIPPTLLQLPKLGSINLNFNKFHGFIPDFLPQSDIYEISLGWNNLTGPIPESLGHLSNLTMLVLQGNHLNGSILPSLGYMSSLRWLDLSGNRLTGAIPESFGSLTDTIYLQLQGNRLTGPIPTSLGKLSATWLDFSNNRLNGDATFLFGLSKDWSSKINLSNNHLRFNFSSIVLPEHLSILNISHNNIYGSLPKQLEQLYSLDVSYNQLCGPIPTGIAHFGPSFFAHNKCLCGAPLAPCK